MGFDPMTHQPRTDLFSSLPHLLALANLGDLMEHHPFDENAVRLQAEAVQLVKLQYLQFLLQSAASTANNITDRETVNMLNSIPAIKQNPVLNSLQAANPAPFSLGINATTQPLHHPSLLSHLSDPQVPFSFQTSFNSQGDNPPEDSSWVSPFPTTSLLSTMIEETSISNLGDATSSTSRYGGGASINSCWPELFFDDHIMHEILS